MEEHRDTRATSHVVQGVVLGVAVLLVGVLAGFEIRYNTLSFDGGINVQVPLSLLENARYATSYPTLTDFDPRVTTGPTVLLPVGLVFAIAGADSTTAQVPNLVFLVLLVVAAVLYAGRHAGTLGAALAGILVVATPELLDKGLRLWGEVPATTFVIAALLMLDGVGGGRGRGRRSAVGVGLCLGLASLTKVVTLLVVPAFLLAWVVDRVTSRRMSKGDLALATGAFAAPWVAFEGFKLARLGPAPFADWWELFARRVLGQALPIAMPDTPDVGDKLRLHVVKAAGTIGIAPWLLLVLLVATTLLVALLVFVRRRGSHRAIAPSLIALWAGASGWIGWWLLLTPTSRTWYRRMLPGVVLEELLVAVVLAWTVKRLLETGRRGGLRAEPRGVRAAVVVLVLTLSGAVVSLLVENLPLLRLRTAPSQERREVEAVARRIRCLPAEARIYVPGWFQAPVVAFVSGRRFENLEEMPSGDYHRRLDDAYLVVDWMLSKRHEVLDRVLSTVEVEAVVREGDHALYRLLVVEPYETILRPTSVDELRTAFRATDRPYAFAGGLGSMSGDGVAWSRRVSGYLLRWRGERCLRLDLEIPPLGGDDPELELSVDRATVLRRVVPAGSRLTEVIPLEAPRETSQELLVELRLHPGPEARAIWYTGWTLGFGVREVALTSCSPQPGQ